MKSKPAAGEVLDNITRLAHEAEWTDEEIDEALREDGVNPDELVRGVRARLKDAGFELPSCSRCGGERRINVGCAELARIQDEYGRGAKNNAG